MFERSAFETDAGAAFFDPVDATMRSAAGDVPPVAGEFTVDVHGDAHTVSVWNASGVEHRMAAPEFAEVIRNNTGWDRQTPIRLLSCDTGSGPYPFAADLARERGVPVTAPDRPVWTFPDGREPVVTGFDRGPHGEPAPRIPPEGGWNRFSPDGSVHRASDATGTNDAGDHRDEVRPRGSGGDEHIGERLDGSGHTFPEMETPEAKETDGFTEDQAAYRATPCDQRELEPKFAVPLSDVLEGLAHGDATGLRQLAYDLSG